MHFEKKSPAALILAYGEQLLVDNFVTGFTKSYFFQAKIKLL